ncbi:transposase [Acetobacter senegalensis]|uniref:Transposase n=1 Tax=Acetobacter senegalensis TaxID=446692 RepID=A0A0U5F2M0_9PROT|nr:transposase [Acetobacter senegalensis]
MKQPGFFDVEEQLARLSGHGNQLEAFSQTVDFEVFRSDLDKALAYSDGRKSGRPPFDPVIMFKMEGSKNRFFELLFPDFRAMTF